MEAKFIVFEGIDGCGKGTAINYVKNSLKERNIAYACVRDPGGPRISEEIRKILLNPIYEEMSRETELLLYVAARAQLLAEEIEPHLKNDRVVLCDRYDLSTLTYQYVFGGWEDEAPIETTTQVFIGQRKSPDHYILIDLPVHIAKQRLGKEKDRQEQKSEELFEQIRQRYLKYARKWDNVSIVDGGLPKDDVSQLVLEEVEKILCLE